MLTVYTNNNVLQEEKEGVKDLGDYIFWDAINTVSLSYNKLLKYHTLQLGVILWIFISERAKPCSEEKKEDLWGHTAKNYIL